MPALALLALSFFAPFNFGASPASLQDSGRQADEQAQFISALAAQGLHDVLVREAREFLERHPQHGRASHVRYRLAGALFELGRFEEAQGELEPLLPLTDFEFAREVAFRLGQCTLERGDLETAEAAFRRVLGQDPDYLATPAKFLLAETFFRSGQFEQAEESYRAARAAEDAGEYVRESDHALAWCAFERGQWDETCRRVAAFTEAWPSDARREELAYLAGEAHLEAGRPEVALQHFDAVTQGEHQPRAMRGAAFALVALDRNVQAAQRFAALLEGFPEGPWVEEARLHMGIQLHESGHAEEALNALDSAPVPDELLRAQRLFWKARVLASLGAHDRVLETLEQAQAAQPDEELSRRIRVARGDALFELGRGDEAAEIYAEAGTDYALHAAAVARLRAGDAATAESLGRRLLEQTSDDSWRIEARWAIAEARFLVEDWAGGGEHFQALMESESRPERAARAASRVAWCTWFAGRHEEAAGRFAKVHQNWPESAEAEEGRYMMARALEAGGSNQAAAGYAAYLSEHPEGAHADEAHLRLARYEGERGRERLAALVQRVNEPTVLIPARYELAELLAQAGEHEQAAPLYEAVLSDAPGDALVPASAYGAAWSRWSLGQHDRASDLLKDLLQIPELESELALSALELLVWSERDAGRIDNAQRAYEAFAERTQDDRRRFALARVVASSLRESGQHDRAHHLFESLLSGTQDRDVAVEVCIERAWIDLEQQAVEPAEAQARLAARHAPEHPQLAEVFFFLGEAWFERGDDEKACADYAVAAEYAPEEIVPRALYKLGFAELRRGRNDEAARALAGLVEGHPQDELHGESLFLLGEAHLRAERPQAALEPLERLRKSFPKHEVMPKALLRLGTAYAELQRWQESADVLGLLLRDHEGFEAALEAELTRGRALSRLGEARAAKQALRRVIDGDQGQLGARARLVLGRLLLDEGEVEAALSEFLKVALLYAHDEEVAEALFLSGEVLESRGEKDAALARYREAVEKHAETVFGRAARERLSEIE